MPDNIDLPDKTTERLKEAEQAFQRTRQRRMDLIQTVCEIHDVPVQEAQIDFDRGVLITSGDK